MLAWPFSAEELSAAVDAVAEETLRRAGWTAPPVDVLALARGHFGFEVCLDPELPNRGRAQRCGAGRFIYLRPEPRPERTQWTLAHEIGEHLRPCFAERLGRRQEELPPGLSEHLANLFAARLLVPACWFVRDAPRLRFDLFRLKERYATASHEVLAWRLLDLPRPCVVTIVDDNRLTRRRSNAWEPPRTLLSAEIRCQRYVHERSEPGVLQEEGWTIYGWPIHDGAVRREILRSAWDEW